MTDQDGFIGERVAVTDDETDDGMFAPVVVELAVDFLAHLAGEGRALELGSILSRAEHS